MVLTDTTLSVDETDMVVTHGLFMTWTGCDGHKTTQNVQS